MKQFYDFIDNAVINLVANSISSTTVSVSWDSSVTTATFNVEYQLMRTDQCRNENEDPRIIYVGFDKTLGIGGLSPYSTYDITVIAFGASPPCREDRDTISVVTDETGMKQSSYKNNCTDLYQSSKNVSCIF